ncbi:hypothetical protein [Geofilum rubicundum]|uniref:Outer membrane protein beta-barrel domain-containing protein n=1 Tax=Geofilum rubicundum JCM 15548 TaxID=1236989 RepID=A0A0E9M0V6_9BACT|nr:hypothetical protein [Geofilum rubicundum]GAO31432.1 hypothetical protein JCM15548_13792 [Geofilum rubicundum JCM 15548]
MKKLLMICVFWVALVALAHAQKINQLSFASGYYADYFYGSGEPGFIIKGNYGFKMKNDVWINFEIAQTEVREEYVSEPFFVKPGRINETHRWFGACFSKDFSLSEDHILKPSFGLVYSQWVYATPDHHYIREEGEITGVEFQMRGETWHDVGFLINMNYLYRVNEHLYLGMVSGSNFILDLGLEGFYLSPKVEVRF